VRKQNNNEAPKPASPFVALFLLALVVVAVFLIVQSALETPTGEGVPGQGEWYRDRQASQSGP
jgi:hypothetical protein